MHPRPIWSVLESAPAGAQSEDPAHWVSVYGDLLALLDRGASVSIGDGSSGELLAVDPAEVAERLVFWRSQLSPVS